MTRAPIPNCPQEDKPIRDRAWTEGQLTDMHREAFDLWRDSLPEKLWAKYDLSACKLGFDAGYEAALRYRDEQEKQA